MNAEPIAIVLALLAGIFAFTEAVIRVLFESRQFWALAGLAALGYTLVNTRNKPYYWCFLAPFLILQDSWNAKGFELSVMFWIAFLFVAGGFVLRQIQQLQQSVNRLTETLDLRAARDIPEGGPAASE